MNLLPRCPSGDQDARPLTLLFSEALTKGLTTALANVTASKARLLLSR